MREFGSFIRWDVTVQARNGFYYASVFVALAMCALVVSLPASMRASADVWVPAVFVFNLVITTFFFVTGLLLLERDEGTLTALGVAPIEPSTFLLTRITTLTGLATVETMIIVMVGFGMPARWPLLLIGAIGLGLLYTCVGIVVASRYESVNALLLPASCLVVFLMSPLLPHFGLLSRTLFVAHPIEPALTLLRSGYLTLSAGELAAAMVGLVFWSAASFAMARNRVIVLMRDTRATGGR